MGNHSLRILRDGDWAGKCLGTSNGSQVVSRSDLSRDFLVNPLPVGKGRGEESLLEWFCEWFDRGYGRCYSKNKEGGLSTGNPFLLSLE